MIGLSPMGVCLIIWSISSVCASSILFKISSESLHICDHGSSPRARYLLLLIYGEDHPEMATCDSNIAIILHSIKDYRNSHTFLANALVIQNK